MTHPRGLVGMRGNLCSKAVVGFESQHCKLDGHFSYLGISCKNCNVCLKRRK